jgi:hypothetical protein
MTAREAGGLVLALVALALLAFALSELVPPLPPPRLR